MRSGVTDVELPPGIEVVHAELAIELLYSMLLLGSSIATTSKRAPLANS